MLSMADLGVAGNAQAASRLHSSPCPRVRTPGAAALSCVFAGLVRLSPTFRGQPYSPWACRHHKLDVTESGHVAAGPGRGGSPPVLLFWPISLGFF